MQKSVDYIKSVTGGFVPEIGVILGSGLGNFAQSLNGIKIPYADIPNFKISTTKGHSGNLIFEEIEEKKTVLMSGRVHYYEGHKMSDVVFPIAVMQKLGVKTLIITNAAGSTDKNLKVGDLMLIKDHINFMGTNPIIGNFVEEYGSHFPDMSEVYSEDLRNRVKNVAKNIGIDLKEGIYLATTGPSYETPSEIKLFSSWGVSAVGMSTVPEAIWARYAGLKIVGISTITNYASGISKTPLSHNEVILAGKAIQGKFSKLIIEIIKCL